MSAKLTHKILTGILEDTRWYTKGDIPTQLSQYLAEPVDDFYKLVDIVSVSRLKLALFLLENTKPRAAFRVVNEFTQFSRTDRICQIHSELALSVIRGSKTALRDTIFNFCIECETITGGVVSERMKNKIKAIAEFFANGVISNQLSRARAVTCRHVHCKLSHLLIGKCYHTYRANIINKGYTDSISAGRDCGVYNFTGHERVTNLVVAVGSDLGMWKSVVERYNRKGWPSDAKVDVKVAFNRLYRKNLIDCILIEWLKCGRRLGIPRDIRMLIRRILRDSIGGIIR